MDTIVYNCKIIWISFILFLMTCLVNGQVKKTRPLTQKDYHLWSTLTPVSISDHGKWVSYTLSYESGLDTLFVKNTATAKTIALPKGHNGKFVRDSWLGCSTFFRRASLRYAVRNGRVVAVQENRD